MGNVYKIFFVLSVLFCMFMFGEATVSASISNANIGKENAAYEYYDENFFTYFGIGGLVTGFRTKVTVERTGVDYVSQDFSNIQLFMGYSIPPVSKGGSDIVDVYSVSFNVSSQVSGTLTQNASALVAYGQVVGAKVDLNYSVSQTRTLTAKAGWNTKYYTAKSKETINYINQRCIMQFRYYIWWMDTPNVSHNNGTADIYGPYMYVETSRYTPFLTA